jgi:hypothetical protein
VIFILIFDHNVTKSQGHGDFGAHLKIVISEGHHNFRRHQFVGRLPTLHRSRPQGHEVSAGQSCGS